MFPYHIGQGFELAPTEYALRMRPVFIISLIALVALVIGKFVIRDFWGAISLIFVVLVGLFVLAGEFRINPSSASFFSIMCLISAIFEVISCVLYFKHSKYRVFDTKAPGIVLLAQTVILISPGLLLLCAIIGWSIFADCNAAQERLRIGDPPEYNAFGQGMPPAMLMGMPRQQAQPLQRQSPVPFQGLGRRLEADY